MKLFIPEFIAGAFLVAVLGIITAGGLENLHDVQEITAGIILLATLIVFTLGKSPVFRVDRAGMSIIGASLMTAFGILSIEEAVQSIDAQTIVVLFSLMVIVSNLKLAGFFAYVGRLIFVHIHSGKMLLLSVIAIAGLLSSVVINDIVCLLFTPIVIMICLQVKVNPVPYLLAVAMSSNIGSACTFSGIRRMFSSEVCLRFPQESILRRRRRCPSWDWRCCTWHFGWYTAVIWRYALTM